MPRCFAPRSPAAVVEAREIARGVQSKVTGVMLMMRQDEGGLPGQMCASIISVLAAMAETMGVRHASALASSRREDATSIYSGTGVENIDFERAEISDDGARGHCSVGAAMTSLQECLVYLRRATLATAGDHLRVSCSYVGGFK